jgi:hypothetical protein
MGEDLASGVNRLRENGSEYRATRNSEIAACMKRSGFTFLAPKTGTLKLPPIRYSFLLSKEFALTYGYGLDQTQKYLDEKRRLPTTEVKAYFEQEHACMLVADKKPSPYITKMNELGKKFDSVETRIRKNKKYREYETRWAQCMKRLGYKLSRFESAMDFVSNSSDTSARRKLELELAGDDLACRASFEGELERLTQDLEQTAD